MDQRQLVRLSKQLVELGLSIADPPEFLYHGTVATALPCACPPMGKPPAGWARGVARR